MEQGRPCSRRSPETQSDRRLVLESVMMNTYRIAARELVWVQLGRHADTFVNAYGCAAIGQ